MRPGNVGSHLPTRPRCTSRPGLHCPGWPKLAAAQLPRDYATASAPPGGYAHRPRRCSRITGPPPDPARKAPASHTPDTTSRSPRTQTCNRITPGRYSEDQEDPRYPTQTTASETHAAGQRALCIQHGPRNGHVSCGLGRGLTAPGGPTCWDCKASSAEPSTRPTPLENAPEAQEAP